MKTQGITTENVHYWQSANPFTNQWLADIPSHGLSYFKDVDSLVNWLFLNGFKQSAREINKNTKGA